MQNKETEDIIVRRIVRRVEKYLSEHEKKHNQISKVEQKPNNQVAPITNAAQSIQTETQKKSPLSKIPLSKISQIKTTETEKLRPKANHNKITSVTPQSTRSLKETSSGFNPENKADSRVDILFSQKNKHLDNKSSLSNITVIAIATICAIALIIWIIQYLYF